MLLRASVRAAQLLHLDDITDTTPSAGAIGSEAEQKVKGLIALFLWFAVGLMFIGLVWAITSFTLARHNNPQRVDAAKRQLGYAIVGLILFGGAKVIYTTATGIL